MPSKICTTVQCITKRNSTFRVSLNITNISTIPSLAKQLQIVTVTPSQKYGIHGYDNEMPSMRAIFFANGPKFRKQFLHPPFDNLDLFNLICLVLDIEPTPNNGTMANIRNLLIDSQSESNGNKLGIDDLIYRLMILKNFV